MQIVRGPCVVYLRGGCASVGDQIIAILVGCYWPVELEKVQGLCWHVTNYGWAISINNFCLNWFRAGVVRAFYIYLARSKVRNLYSTLWGESHRGLC